MFQRFLKRLEVIHPLNCKTVLHYVHLCDYSENKSYALLCLPVQLLRKYKTVFHCVHLSDTGEQQNFVPVCPSVLLQ